MGGSDAYAYGYGPDGYYDPQLAQQMQQQQNEADAAWKQVLAKNHGGHYGAGGFTTDFEAAGDTQALVDMVANANPGRISSVADQYMKIHDQIADITKELHTHVNNMLEHWTGPAADGFRTHAETLHTSLTNSLTYAKNAHTALKSSSESLTRAQSNIKHAPSWWDRASRALTSERSDYQFKTDAAKYGLAEAVQKDGSQLSAQMEAKQHNVLVMQSLGTDYNNNAAILQQTPGGGRENLGVWPQPVKEHTGSVTQPSSGTPESPNSTSGGGVVTGGGHYSGPGGGGISGGIAQPHLTGLPSTTGIDGVSGGQGGSTGVINPTGPQGFGGGSAGGHSGLGGVGGLGVIGGLGATGGLGGRSRFGGGGFAGEGGLGKGGLGGAASEAELTAAERAALGGRGGAALEGEAGMAGESAFTKGGSGIGGGAAEGEGGMGNRGMMGGMGGMGRGGGRKKDRKGRADYLVEDEETWMQDDVPNPPVIG
ncbi:WXG100 family type VII secretion target [Phaeacidiphilus oryzae]|uniref:WXG100 family type VII secretion target n=1 Tax=Phaeacidiphilus oryzae TaxID=348818 RepID=UPI000691EB90|nr:hypothetical protein [Phaeacidiphilus oryzae]